MWEKNLLCVGVTWDGEVFLNCPIKKSFDLLIFPHLVVFLHPRIWWCGKKIYCVLVFLVLHVFEGRRSILELPTKKVI